MDKFGFEEQQDLKFLIDAHLSPSRISELLTLKNNVSVIPATSVFERLNNKVYTNSDLAKTETTVTGINSNAECRNVAHFNTADTSTGAAKVEDKKGRT